MIILARVNQDAISRLQSQMESGSVLDEKAALCHAGLQRADSEWALTTRPGMFLRAAGQAMLQAKCTSVAVEVRETWGCFTHLPIKHSNWKFLDLANGLLMSSAAPTPCSEVTPQLFQAVDGHWYRHKGAVVPSPDPAEANIWGLQERMHPLEKRTSIYSIYPARNR